MEYRYLGNAGIQVSAISLGSWVTFANQVDVAAAEKLMKIAFDAGVNFFDNAEAYAAGESERVMGAALANLGWARSEYLVSTKIFWGGEGVNQRGLSRKHVLEGTDAALERLGLEYVDLIFCHRADLHTPVEETVRAMSHVIDQGKALYWGTSEWSAERILDAYHIARRERLIPPVMEQPQYNLFHRDRFEREYAPLYERFGLGTTIWSPLAGGLLTGKYQKGVPVDSRSNVESYEWLRSRYEGDEARSRIAKIDRLMNIADEIGCTMAQLAIAWCLKNPKVSTAIIGASRPDQLEENLKALDAVDKLTDEVMERIEEILDNRPKQEKDWR